MGTNSAVLRQAGAAGVALLIAVSLIAGVGAVSADSHTDGDGEGAEDGDTVFPDPVEISVAGLTVSVGPPADVDDDGVYNDINGDGEVTVFDALLHAVVVTAVDAGELALTDEQAAAVDVNGDGAVTYDDAFEIAAMADMDVMANA